MNAKHLFIFSSLSLILTASVAHADSRRGGFSQLDFDRPAAAAPVVKQKPTVDQIKEILTAPEPVKEPAKPAIPAIKEPRIDATARASLETPQAVKTSAIKPAVAPSLTKFDWVKPQEGTSHFLIPRLKGPAVDKDNNQLITTSTTWRRTAAAACQDVTDGEALCNKAKALKEVMSRFSGNDEFFDAQCQQTCPSPDQVAVLTGFAVKAVPEGEFRMTENNKVCHYQIKSNVEPPRWQLLQGERGTCNCLPKSCL